MAEKRMFAKTIIDSDAFLDMPLSAQALYFHLCMRADDDGFVNNPKRIQRVVGSSDDDAKLLIAKRFVIPFESGVIVIKHWRLHNTIQKDRYKPTPYQEELSQLTIKENKAYTLSGDSVLETGCIQDVNRLETQSRLEKIREDKTRLVVFNLSDGSEYTPDEAKLNEWQRAFPHLLIDDVLRKCAAKHNSMARRRNVLTIDQYIVNWLLIESEPKKKQGFSDMPEHAPTNDRELKRELSGRNGNLV